MAIETLNADSPVNWAKPQPSRAAAPASWGEHEAPDTGTVDMSFWDFVDIVNPLQHIPIVNTVYRELTGDQINGTARILGGSLFGGVIGGLVAVAGVVTEQVSGKDPGEHVLALFKGGKEAPVQSVQLAESGKAATPAPAAPAEAMAEALPASETMVAVAGTMAASAAAVPERGGRAFAAPARPDAPSSRSFPVPGRVAGLQPRPMPTAASNAYPELAKAPAQKAAAQLAVEKGNRPAGPEQAQVQAQAEAQAPAPAAAGTAASWPPGGPAPLPPELVADAMLNALNKYQQSSARNSARAQPSGQIDSRL